ncbi:MAG: RTX toxin, partial [Actinobacteria bacterium]|nr:RTX toxin [Actinomycetota bacterium]
MPSWRRARCVAGASSHTCALLDDRSVRCWGFGDNGRLGYGHTQKIGDNEAPGPVGPVNIGGPALAIAAGGGHTCAVIDDGSGVKGPVRCWGYGRNGQLGYGDPTDIGEDETPASHTPVNLGPGRTALAITAGEQHTCALLDDRSVRCWGFGERGSLGYGRDPAQSAAPNIGDDETPNTAGPVNLGGPATAITAGGYHTCARLTDGSVRCWGMNFNGQLGYGSVQTIGDDPNETPNTAGPVSFGGGRTALAISAGEAHTCARLDDMSVRCWGDGSDGRLGYGNTTSVGDSPTTRPDTVGAVYLGSGRTALAVTAGGGHTCARLDDGGVRCWGNGLAGRLGY